MPAADSPAVLVARFLQANHYKDTLETFLKEAGLPPDAGTIGRGDLTIEKILEEKKVFDISVAFERIGVGQDGGWSLPAPSNPSRVSALPTSANLLHVSVESIKDAPFAGESQLLLATTADRRLNFFFLDSKFTLFKSQSQLQDSPILSCIAIGNGSLTTISSGMSGQVVLYDHNEDRVLEERRDHKKYVVKVITWEDLDAIYVASAGWDGKVFLYRIENKEAASPRSLGAPIASLTLPTNPETVTFIKHPDCNLPVLLVTRRDSTSIHYYAIPSARGSEETPSQLENLRLLGHQNLAPHSNAWISFSPSSVALSPTDPTLLAVATSAVPHMKLIIVRLLLPPLTASPESLPRYETQGSQTRARLAVQDREDQAIQVHVSTLAPQTLYSTPQVCWRPDGSGVWVNGDDGVLRGVEAKTGKVVATLKDGHEVGSKIRSLWAGLVDTEGQKEEWVVSGGFDRRLVVWKVTSDT